MWILTLAALYFILWWLVLFLVLPFRLRTQEEEQDVTLGTIRSAPHGSHALRAMLWTTLWTSVIFAALLIAVTQFGLSFDTIPRMVPDFR